MADLSSGPPGSELRRARPSAAVVYLLMYRVMRTAPHFFVDMTGPLLFTREIVSVDDGMCI
jgi:hypothetical protein